MSEICDCGKEMEGLGNVDNIIYTSYPPQWDEVWICRSCEKKRIRRVYGEASPDYSWLKEYEKIK
jgi:hypothetical protein